MKTSAIRHLSFYPFVQPLARNEARFLMESAYQDVSSAEIVWWKRTEPDHRHTIPMEIRYNDHTKDQWSAAVVFPEEAHYIKYCFRLTDNEGNTLWLNSIGFHDSFSLNGSYEILQINHTDVISVPDWTQGCIY